MPSTASRRLSREGLLHLGILVVLLTSAVTSGINLLVLIFGMLVGALILNWLLVRPTVGGATPNRRLPSSVFAGEPFAVEIALCNRNRYWANWSIRVEDRIRAGKQRFRPSVWFPHVPPGGSRTAYYRGVLPRRGRYELGPLRISTRFPLGLARAERESACQESLIVYPRLGKLTARWFQGWEELDALKSRGAQSRSSLDDEFRSLREFRSGDSTRWIHWRTSARQGELMVREFEHPQTQDSLILLDLWAPETAGQQELENVEHAVSFVGTLCADACRTGKGRVVLGIAAREKQVIQGQASPGLIHRLLTALACAEAAPWTNVEALLEEIHRYGTAEGRLVIVGTRAADWFDESRSHVIRRVVRRTRGRTLQLDVSGSEFVSYFQR